METSDLERRLRDAFSDDDHRLLESAKGDAARPGARDEMLAVLGVAGAAAPERFVARLGRYLRGSGGSLLSSVFVALVIGAAASTAVIVWRSSESPPAPVASLAVSPAAARAVSSEEPPLAPRAPAPIESSIETNADRAPVIAPDSLPSAPAATSTAPAQAKASALPPTDTLGREIARVDAARAALEHGEVTRALALLDAYDREFSTGAFAVEVSVLRIEALARAGKTEQARRLGTRFLANHPRDAFARRVASTLDALPAARHDASEP